MVRRWSLVVELVKDFNESEYVKKRFKFRLFRLNVRFRRFNLKKTKFKRKSLMQFKRQANWYLYFNIVKSWSKDFKFIKKVIKYQYLYNLFNQNCVIFDPNFFKFKSDHYLYDFSGKIVTITNRSYFYFYNKKFKPSFSSNVVLASSFEGFDGPMNVFPFWSYYDFSGYQVNLIKNDESKSCDFWNSWYPLFFSVIEIKKILNIFFFLFTFRR